MAAEGIWDEQRKFIKYNHLVANLLIYHNMVNMTTALERLTTDGHAFDEDLVASTSPYQTEHINRLGRYTLKRDRIPEPLDGIRVLQMPLRSEGVDRAAKALCDNPTRIPYPFGTSLPARPWKLQKS